ncbi:MAG: UbiA family prenyltransferase [Bacteroidota bacterium]
MASFFIKLLNLILYSNLWIALAAVATTAQTFLLLKDKIDQPNFLIFVCASTLFIYAVHRIVGLQKVKPFQSKGRYLVISTFKSHIIIYAIVAGITAFVCFWKLQRAVQLSLVVPSVVALAYVLPMLAGKKRLRDIHFVKIFLVAIVWAWVGVILPVLQIEQNLDASVWWMVAERALFIFAITLPFDIRDLKIDEHANVQTIPAKIGVQRSKRLAFLALVGTLICSYQNVMLGTYSSLNWWALALSAASTGILIFFSDRKMHDYYFTALLDGTIIFQFLLVVLLEI